MCKTHPTGTSKPPFYSSKNTCRIQFSPTWPGQPPSPVEMPVPTFVSVVLSFAVEVVYETWLSHVGFKRKNSPPLVKYDGHMIHFLQTVIMIDVAIKIRILGIHYWRSILSIHVLLGFVRLLIWRSLTKLTGWCIWLQNEKLADDAVILEELMWSSWLGDFKETLFKLSGDEPFWSADIFQRGWKLVLGGCRMDRTLQNKWFKQVKTTSVYAVYLNLRWRCVDGITDLLLLEK